MSYCVDCKHFGHHKFSGEFICTKTGRAVGMLNNKDCFTPKTTDMENQDTPKTKVCKRCGRELPVTEFGKHCKTKDGLQPYCRECSKASVTEARMKRREGSNADNPGPPPRLLLR